MLSVYSGQSQRTHRNGAPQRRRLSKSNTEVGSNWDEAFDKKMRGKYFAPVEVHSANCAVPWRWATLGLPSELEKIRRDSSVVTRQNRYTSVQTQARFASITGIEIQRLPESFAEALVRMAENHNVRIFTDDADWRGSTSTRLSVISANPLHP